MKCKKPEMNTIEAQRKEVMCKLLVLLKGPKVEKRLLVK